MYSLIRYKFTAYKAILDNKCTFSMLLSKPTLLAILLTFSLLDLTQLLLHLLTGPFLSSLIIMQSWLLYPSPQLPALPSSKKHSGLSVKFTFRLFVMTLSILPSLLIPKQLFSVSIPKFMTASLLYLTNMPL